MDISKICLHLWVEMSLREKTDNTMIENKNMVEATLQRATDTRALKVGSGVVAECGAMFRELFGSQKAIIVADTQTIQLAGEAVQKSLAEAGIEQETPFIFNSVGLVSDWSFVEQLDARLATTDAVAVAIGAGTINDLAKICSYHVDRSYMVVATAVSMDGYTAYGAPMIKDGMKQTFDCSAPMGVIADTDIIATCPPKMIASGYADLLAKIPTGADWILADRLGVEPMDDFSFSLVQDGLREALANPQDICNGSQDALIKLTEGLLMSGFAMQAHRSSRPASGAEHLFARLWEMEHRLFGDNVPSHGFMVAIGLLCSTALFECLLKEDIEALDIEAAVAAWPTAEEARLDALVTFEGTDFPLIGVKETAAKYINKRELRNQLKTLKANWSEIRTAVENQLFTYEECRSLLAAVGAPTEPEEIGISRSRLKESVIKAVKIRRRFTILDLGLRCGLLDKWMDELFGPGGMWEITE